MAKPKITQGPIGNGWIDEVKTSSETKYVARWNRYEADSSAPDGRRRVRGGSYDIGPKVYHGPNDALTSKKKALNHWLRICDSVMGRSERLHPCQKAQRTFEWFVENEFERTRKTRWRETSEYAFDYIKGKLYERFRSVPLNEMDDPAMQVFLNTLAEQGYSYSVVRRCRTYLNAILEHAVEEDVLPSNRARRLKLPENLKAEETPYLSSEEYLNLLQELPTKRDQTMASVLYFGAVRRGELFGIKWGDYSGDSIAVKRQTNRFFKVVKPKTKSSIATISIPPMLEDAVNEWRELCPDCSPTAFMFPSKNGSPIHFKNWSDRVLKPAAARAKIERITYTMFRRGFATESHQNKKVDKNIQAQMRHSSPDITRNVYMQNVPEAHKAAVSNLEKAIGISAEKRRELKQHDVRKYDPIGSCDAPN